MEAHKLGASDAEARDEFGFSVSLSGDRAFVGARGDDDNGSGSGAGYLFELGEEREDARVNEDLKITASDAAANDLFGEAMATDGNRTIVGANDDDDNGTNSGSAYIYEFDGTNVDETKLTASDGARNDRFGESVSLSGDRALVGTPLDDDNGTNSGSAYIYEFDGAEWVETHKLTASDAGADDRFGESVSLSGDRVLVGARGDDDNGSGSGAAYLFEFNGMDWVEITKLTASDAAADDVFGVSVSVTGDRALVGAMFDDDEGEDSGSAYLFEFNGTEWVETHKLGASDAAANDVFGTSVSLSGDRALVGAPSDDDNGTNTGSVYLFELTGTNVVETKLTASDAGAGDAFGSSVSLSGNRALVGARGDDDNGSASGAAYLFEFNDTSFVETKLTASDAEADDRFGVSVAISGDRALVGSPLDGDNGSRSGSAYLFELEEEGEVGNIHIADISIRAFQNKRGAFRVKATVLVVDGDGNRVGSANVTGRFSGDINMVQTRLTNERGLARLNEVVNAEPTNYFFCVEAITGGAFAYDKTKNLSSDFDCSTATNTQTMAL